MKQYKVYTKGNYLVVVDVQLNEYFYGIRKEVHVDKSNKNTPTYRIFKVKDFSDALVLQIPNILKEDGSVYSLEEWETFYTEDTGNFNGGGTAPDLSNKWKKEQLSGFTYTINIDNNELSYYELYFVKDDRSKDFSDPNFEVTNNSITINSGFPLDGVVCFYRKIEL